MSCVNSTTITMTASISDTDARLPIILSPYSLLSPLLSTAATTTSITMYLISLVQFLRFRKLNTTYSKTDTKKISTIVQIRLVPLKHAAIFSMTVKFSVVELSPADEIKETILTLPIFI